MISPGTVVGNIDVEAAVELSFRIEDLMILLTDSERGLDFPILETHGGALPIEIYYPRLERSQEPVSLSNCWTRFANIADIFGSIIESWLSKHESFGPGFHLYLGNRRRTQMYAEHRFASLVWGLESLHRRMSSTDANTALKGKIARIIAQITNRKDQKWAERQLSYAGESSLASRLFDIFNELPLGLGRKQLEDFTRFNAVHT